MCDMNCCVWLVSGAKSLLQTSQTPRLYVRLVTPPKSRRATHTLLPPTIVIASTHTQAISCFRHSVGVSCLRGRLGLPLQSEYLLARGCMLSYTTTGSIVKPSLNVFLKAIDQPDVMDTILVMPSVSYADEVLTRYLFWCRLYCRRD